MIIRKCATKGAFEVIPEKNMKIDLGKIKKIFEVIVDMPMLLLIKIGNSEATVYKTGKLIIRNVNSKELAQKIAENIYNMEK